MQMGISLTFLSVNQGILGAKVTERASASGITFDFEISSVDAMPAG